MISVGEITPRSRLTIKLAAFCGAVAPIQMGKLSGAGSPLQAAWVRMVRPYRWMSGAGLLPPPPFAHQPKRLGVQKAKALYLTVLPPRDGCRGC